MNLRDFGWFSNMILWIVLIVNDLELLGGICLCGLPWVVWVIESHNSINPGREFDFLYTLWKFQYWRHNCINWGTELNILYTFLRVHYWRQPALGCCALAVTGFWPMGRRRLTGAGWCAAPARSICALYWHPEAGAANWKTLVQFLLDLSIASKGLFAQITMPGWYDQWDLINWAEPSCLRKRPKERAKSDNFS